MLVYFTDIWVSEEVGLPKHIKTLSKGAGKRLPLNAKDYFETPPHPAGLISPVPVIRKYAGNTR
jgi:hypothetical protein